MNIFEVLKSMGFETVPQDFYSLIGVWKNWYDGDVKKFHTYKVFNGQKKVTVRRFSTGMAKKTSEDIANLLMNEKVHTTLEGDAEQEFIDSVAIENNLQVKMNEAQETKAGFGTMAYVPRVENVSVDASTGAVLKGNNARIKIDFVTAPNIFPLSWENGFVKECAFATEKVDGKKTYLYLQIHRINSNGFYDIENHLYLNNRGNLTEAELSELNGFEKLPPVVHTNSDKRQFVIDRLNIANNYDVSLPMGIAIFANAIDQLKGVDIAYDSYVNEFVLGKKRIMVKPEATKNFDGEPYFDSDDLAYYVMPEDSSGDSFIKEIDMKLRTAEHNAGIQDMLNMLSAKCGFGENHYRFNQGSISTATQIVSENSTMFRNIKKHELILESVMKELCRIILRLGNTYLGLNLDEDVEISIDFDDSIIEDKETDFNRDARMVQMGILNDYEFRAKWLNETEETAKAALPGMENMLSGDA